MRLLHTRTKQLETFYGENIPRYAILSHMWGREEDEVLFRHITGSDADKREGEIRKGYAKIQGACKQAVEDGLDYIWIDTCCIDKASSAELSEAINSMYEWYRESRVCYVYLEDVSSGGDRWAGNDKDAIFPIVSFEHSRWFSRGWTLQELIAPKCVVFFSKDWVDIGTKTGLRDTISAVTRIRIEMLTAYDPEKASVAEKMSWAAFRTTTRVEDVAYCMMGLLGVNMPLLYGEGNRAFRRLQEEFMKGSDDDSLFAWKSRLDSYNYYRENLDNPRGMLAASPWEFRDGMDIVRSKDGAYSPYSMTNQGLKIKLPLLPINPGERKVIGVDSEDVFKTVLKCTVSVRTPTRRIAIYLKKVREGHYQRIFPHWLDETETPSNGSNLTSLLVPQPQVNAKYDIRSAIEIEVLIPPTNSGFTLGDHSLVEGKKFHYTQVDSIYVDGHTEMIIFKNRGRRFGVAVGVTIESNDHDAIPWLDFIDVVDEEQSYYKYSYDEGGSRAYLREQHLDRLSERIPEEDWWVTASVKRNYHNRYELHAVIDIQREPIRAKGWYIPPAIPTNNTFFDERPGYHLDHHNVHPSFKKEGHNWSVMFNPKVKRVLDIDLVYTLRHESPSNNCRSPSNSTLILSGLVHCIQFSHDGRYLATGSNMVQVYDMESSAEICTFVNESYRSTNIYSICFSPDSNFIATGDSGGCIKLWDINTKCIHKIFNDHQNTVDFLCFSPDVHLIISGSKGSDIVRIWKIADGTSRILTLRWGTGLQSIAISPNGSLLATGGSSGHIQIWDMLTIRLLEEFPRHGNEVYITFTPDGKGLVSGSTDKTLRYWNVSGLVQGGFEAGGSSVLAVSNLGKISRPKMTFGRHKGSITSVAVSHDGRWVISQSTSGRLDNNVLFWDLKNATAQFVLEELKPTFHQYTSLSTSPAGNVFATIGDMYKMVQVWHYDIIKSQDNPSSHRFLMFQPRPM